MDRRKELKQQYKMTELPIGIYRIHNLANGMSYLGRSLNLDGAHNSCMFQLKYEFHKNKSLMEEWKTFGEKNFVFEILQQIETSDEPGKNYNDELKDLEKEWFEKLKPNVQMEYK